eukprot:9071210-Alexandrium_andersonii.AAC.1
MGAPTKKKSSKVSFCVEHVDGEKCKRCEREVEQRTASTTQEFASAAPHRALRKILQSAGIAA